MTDALDAMKAKFDALAVAPASTFTSYRGYQRRVDTGTGKTAGRFVFFRVGPGELGARGAGNTAEMADGAIVMLATMPCPAAPTAAEQDMLYDLVRQLDQSLGTRQISSGGRSYSVHQGVTHDGVLVATGLPWAAGLDQFIIRAQFDVEYTGV